VTKAEYAQYQQTVSEFMQSNGLRNLSRVSDTEEFFSWSPCDCCESPLGGSRIEADGWSEVENGPLEFTICTDCEYYAEYGRLDDRTMMEIEAA
jgi:hypothetical protein